MSATETHTNHPSRFWVFSEAQLEEAVAEFMANEAGALSSDKNQAVIMAFLHSNACTERGMRRGGPGDHHEA